MYRDCVAHPVKNGSLFFIGAYQHDGRFLFILIVCLCVCLGTTHEEIVQESKRHWHKQEQIQKRQKVRCLLQQMACADRLSSSHQLNGSHLVTQSVMITQQTSKLSHRITADAMKDGLFHDYLQVQLQMCLAKPCF